MIQLNLFVEYQKNSIDFLRALGEMQMIAGNDAKKPVYIQRADYVKQLAVYETFWDMTETIFHQYEERLALAKLQAINEHAKAIILRHELKMTYNEMYKVKTKIPDVILKLMKNTALPADEVFQEEVNLKSRGEDNQPT